MVEIVEVDKMTEVLACGKMKDIDFCWKANPLRPSHIFKETF